MCVCHLPNMAAHLHSVGRAADCATERQPPSGREGEPLVVRYAMPGKYPSTERSRVQLAHVLSDGYGKDFEVPPERLDEIRRELDGIADAMPGLELLTEWTTALG